MQVSKKSVVRLSHYRKALLRLKELGFSRIFSKTLADEIGVTSAQVRKDFSIFGISGNKRGGYKINELTEDLRRILKKDNEYQIVIAGAGNIGRALMNYERFREDNIRIVAAFDIDPTKIGDKLRVPVYPLTEMEEYIRKNKIPLGIIAVPDVAAQSIFDLMIRAGIKGILNFTTIRFKGAEDVTISNVYLQFELENIIYNLK